MREWSGKRYWIVGASAGLGRAVAERMSALGCELILSARSEDALVALANTLPGKAEVVPMDVSDNDSVKAAAASVGRIDGLVYLAAVYWPMNSREWDADNVTTMMDINLTGAARVLGQVVPAMVGRGEGHVVLTGSLSGYRGLPRSLGYGASKAGLMYLAESMHADLRGSGIDVQLINPGFVRTRLTDKNEFSMPFIMEPDEAARLYVEHMTGDAFSRNFPRHFGAMFRLSNFLPDWLYYRVFG